MDSLAIVGLAFGFVALVWVALNHVKTLIVLREMYREKPQVDDVALDKRLTKLETALVDNTKQVDSLKTAVGLKQLGR